MVRWFAAVRRPSEPRVRHVIGLPGAGDRSELPEPTVAVIDERSEGYYLIRFTNDGTFCGDTWHPTPEEARGQADFEFDRVGEWREIPGEISDPGAYAIRHAK